jgi:hypothetical protein
VWLEGGGCIECWSWRPNGKDFVCVCGGDERSVLSQKAVEETVSRTAGECVSIPWVYWGLQVGQCTLGNIGRITLPSTGGTPVCRDAEVDIYVDMLCNLSFVIRRRPTPAIRGRSSRPRLRQDPHSIIQANTRVVTTRQAIGRAPQSRGIISWLRFILGRFCRVG